MLWFSSLGLDVCLIFFFFLSIVHIFLTHWSIHNNCKLICFHIIFHLKVKGKYSTLSKLISVNLQKRNNNDEIILISPVHKVNFITFNNTSLHVGLLHENFGFQYPVIAHPAIWISFCYHNLKALVSLHYEIKIPWHTNIRDCLNKRERIFTIFKYQFFKGYSSKCACLWNYLTNYVILVSLW